MPVHKLPTGSVTIKRETDYPLQILTESPWYSFIRKNGYRKLAQRLKIKVFKGIEEAESLWRYFSPNENLFDLWETRKLFFESYGIEPHFLTLYESGSNPSILATLPLWFDDSYEYKGKFAWYGGYWPEENTFFTKDLEYVPLLLIAAPKPLVLECIKPNDDYLFLNSLEGFSQDPDKKYFLNLENIHTIEDFIGRLKKKKRYNIRRDIKRISSLSPTVMKGNLSDLYHLFRLNIRTYRLRNGKDPSIFEDIRQRKLFEQMLSAREDVQPRITATKISGNVEAVELSFIYKRTYYAVTSGANFEKYSGIGVFSNIEMMKDAIESGCTKIDFFEGDYNWKESWSLDTTHHFRFIK